MLEKLRAGLTRFFQGRNGMDKLGLTTLWAAVLLNLIDAFLGTGVLQLISMALWIWTLFRMLSRNLAKRQAENLRFLQFWYEAKKRASQFFTRLRNIRKYKYVRCPGCKALIRMPRGIGKKQITCSGCHTTFSGKA